MTVGGYCDVHGNFNGFLTCPYCAKVKAHVDESKAKASAMLRESKRIKKGVTMAKNKVNAEVKAEVKSERNRKLKTYVANLDGDQDAAYQAFKLLEKEHKAEVAILRTFWKSHYLSVGHRCLGKMLVGNFGKVDK